MSRSCFSCAFYRDGSFNGGICSVHESHVKSDASCPLYITPLDYVLAVARFNRFYDLTEKFYQYTGICPRCGKFIGFNNDDTFVAFFSRIHMCSSCVVDELPASQEDYSNWAVVCACRTVCDIDIKL